MRLRKRSSAASIQVTPECPSSRPLSSRSRTAPETHPGRCARHPRQAPTDAAAGSGRRDPVHHRVARRPSSPALHRTCQGVGFARTGRARGRQPSDGRQDRGRRQGSCFRCGGKGSHRLGEGGCGVPAVGRRTWSWRRSSEGQSAGHRTSCGGSREWPCAGNPAQEEGLPCSSGNPAALRFKTAVNERLTSHYESCMRPGPTAAWRASRNYWRSSHADSAALCDATGERRTRGPCGFRGRRPKPNWMWLNRSEWMYFFKQPNGWRDSRMAVLPSASGYVGGVENSSIASARRHLGPIPRPGKRRRTSGV